MATKARNGKVVGVMDMGADFYPARPAPPAPVHHRRAIFPVMGVRARADTSCVRLGQIEPPVCRIWSPDGTPSQPGSSRRPPPLYQPRLIAAAAG